MARAERGGCRLCGKVVRPRDRVVFGASRRSAEASVAHVDCVAVETLRLIHRREVDRALGSWPRPGV